MGTVVAYFGHETFDASSHESVTRMRIAEKIAALLGYAFAGEWRGVQPGGEQHVYFVPSHTLDTKTARDLGICSSGELFGGVVPHAFVATKSITHPLWKDAARAPAGWSVAFPRDVGDVVLRGYSAFDANDARRAGRALLEQTGAVRVKSAAGVGGRDQIVARNEQALNAAIAALDPGQLDTCGVALEENLTAVTTYSVGHVRIGDHVATYWGTQKLTRDHQGNVVYGGSDLTFARGGFDALLKLEIPEGARRAVEQARIYDAAADRCFAGFLASRRNYDVASGTRSDGRIASGVLEQSWRIGGASSAEIAALEYFAREPARRAVRATCTEDYTGSAPPQDALVYFDGDDSKVGRILKHTTVTPYVDA